MSSPNETHLNSWFGLLSRKNRIFLILVALALIIAILQANSLRARVELCGLFDGCQLRSSEIHRIEIALGKAGLDEFEIQGDRVLVPRKNRAAYLQAIVDQNAVPDHMLPKTNASIRNPFLSRSQQLALEREQKKRQIQDLVMRLPFVYEAWFEMDSARSGLAFDPIQRTAGISVVPERDLTLNPDQVATIRKMISGALAGVDAQQIVVTDLNAGLAYKAQEYSQQAGQDDIAIRASVEPKHHYERQIRESLAMYEGLEIDIQFQWLPWQRNSKANDDQIAINTPDRSFGHDVDVGRATILAGTNGQASISDHPESDVPNGARPPSEAKFDPMRSVGPLPFQRVSVSVTVPQELVEQFESGQSGSEWKSRKPLSGSMSQVDVKFERLKSEIIDKIRPLLPISSFDNPSAYPISVTMRRTPTAHRRAGSWSARIAQLARTQWPTIAVLGIGLALLIAVGIRSNTDAKDAATSFRSASEHQALTDSQGDPGTRAMKEQISQLIDRDPDTAANVLKSWIRDAA